MIRSHLGDQGVKAAVETVNALTDVGELLLCGDGKPLDDLVYLGEALVDLIEACVDFAAGGRLRPEYAGQR